MTGINAAYASPSGVVVRQGVMYIAGTRTVGDWFRNVAIPLHMTSRLPRYHHAEAQLAGVQRVVGHSMGGSVALELQKAHPELQSTTYGAPVVSARPSRDRVRDYLDPISVFDLGAKMVFRFVPHTAGRSR